ncbi:MAG: pimeloyl-ACP methyl ester carboxylesterase/nicotinamidase-related amidase [Salibacteraceae bacterium]|jgi:pimeloyl-ACP methyl ester carboxylesterase/nicotinamidase-related amidase
MKNSIQYILVAILLNMITVMPAKAQLPDPGFTIDNSTAIVITDPQNDFLSLQGVTWGVVGESVTKNKTVENLETLFKLAEANNIKVFISPHYYYKHDHIWQFEGALETLMHKISMFDRGDQLKVEGFEGSGADFLDRYKKYIEKDFVTVVGPHKIYGPEQNDLSLQLRKQKIDKVILAGMSGNLCVESHLRELLEDGFEVAVVGDATASAIVPGYDGDMAAQTNFRFLASHVYATRELQEVMESNTNSTTTTFNTIKVNGLDIFYREAGSKTKPTIVLLHGYPTSSHMFRNLITDLSVHYHVLAPDYPGYGRSEQPAMKDFEYTFDNMALIVEDFLGALNVAQYSLYLMDYGAPIGFRIATKHPKRVQSLIIQNGNAYTEGLRDFWIPIKKYWKNNTLENGKALEGFHSPDGLKWQYTHGVQDVSKISPDNWEIDLQHLSRPENNDIQLAMFYDYRTNVPLYPKWQKYMRDNQPPTLIVWGKNDYIFPAEGAFPYKEDLNNLEFHLLNTGHFALEEKGTEIAHYILNFLQKNHIK